MKRLIIPLVLIAAASALPGAAQTGQVSSNTSPQALRSQALAHLLLQHAGSGYAPQTPQQRARNEAILAQVNDLDHAGAKALHDGDFAAAEAAFRGLTKADPISPDAYYGLGEALAGQGRVAEAIAAYRAGIYWPSHRPASPTISGPNDAVQSGQDRSRLLFHPNATASASWIKCALLLSQTGQGAEAVAIYKEALPQVPDGSALGIDAPLASGTLSPAGFQAAAHIALGLCATFSGAGHDQAMSEFDVARRLQPDLPLTNYYFGYGWKQLDLKGVARQAYAAQAKAAFQQAAFGEGDVKKAAEEALKGFK